MKKLLLLVAAAGAISAAVVIARRRRRSRANAEPTEIDFERDIVDAEIFMVPANDSESLEADHTVNSTGVDGKPVAAAIASA